MRQTRQLRRSLKLVSGLRDGADRFVDIPNGLVLRILQLQLQPPLFQLRACCVALRRAVAEGNIKRHAIGEVREVVVENIGQGGAQRPS